ncbi:thiopeptide-type bacteriocin biosynthesis protein [Streptomyces griseosporeus]|uniref:thiopeptide-type bacteriocin biosynthesis protein n=1 Tax=Streptomyces griseosporeus TaxID=1910 RepID=UPI0037012BAA
MAPRRQRRSFSLSFTGTRLTFTESGHSTGWHALHIHLPHSLQTAFLRDTIGPLMRNTPAVGRFFFLRYWQGGPHIRLRLDGADEETVASVRAALAAAVPPMTEELTAEYAYEVSLQSELARLEHEQPAGIRPPGTVEPMPYTPEYEKYGGTDGVRIAEDLFCRTSVAVLELAGVRAGPEPKAPVGEAIRIMAMSLKGSGLDVEESREFLARYEEFWRRYVPPGSDRAWPALYDRTRRKVLDLCGAVWLDGRADVFHDVYADARAAAGAVLDSAQYGRCLANYLHTTNNRLGIIPAGEAFVAHVMHRSLGELEHV